MRIRRSAAAEELHRLDGPDLMPCSGGNQNAVSRTDFLLFSVDLHHAGSFEEVIKFFAQFMIMPLGFTANGKGCFGEALILYRCIAEIQETPDGRTILGGEGSLLIALSNFHASNYRDHKNTQVPAALKTSIFPTTARHFTS